jgi:dCMP deaminase
MKTFDDVFMNMVYSIAELSGDNLTHIGAVIVEPDTKCVIASGYNSYPKGISLSVISKAERQQRPTKYSYFIHAEAAALANAARLGISVERCWMYTNGVPCNDCARLIINSGIISVIVNNSNTKDMSEQWQKQAIISEDMFKETSVSLIRKTPSLFKPTIFINGKEIL